MVTGDENLSVTQRTEYHATNVGAGGSIPSRETMKKRSGNIRREKVERRYHDRRDDDERRTVPCEALVKKILVTGDREWSDIPRVVEELKGYRPGTVLVHGACRGADIICAAVAEALGFEVRAYPADWVKFKKAAGPIRNRQMITEEHKPEEPIDLCLAFHNHIQDSTGTADMLDCVVKSAIPWKLNSSRLRSSADSERLPAKEEVAGSIPAGGAEVASVPCTRQSAETTSDK